ncbi:TPA: putative cross-wall-targeting lipoprotein signal domain-containing protein, partial [Streptococcus suis]
FSLREKLARSHNKRKEGLFMTKTCNHHFLVNQEKGEKHVFRKSKKYRTLCSVALGTMVTAVVAWGGTVAHADEVTWFCCKVLNKE